MISALRLFLAVFFLGGMEEVLVETSLAAVLPSQQLGDSFQIKQISGICPQKRKTRQAPNHYPKKENPISPTPENLEQGERLYNKAAKPIACKLCNGAKGNGNGSLARRLNPPPPRRFSSVEVMRDFPDGQLYWIIQNGSRVTTMPAHKSTLKPDEIWQLILFLKSFLKV